MRGCCRMRLLRPVSSVARTFTRRTHGIRAHRDAAPAMQEHARTRIVEAPRVGRALVVLLVGAALLFAAASIAVGRAPEPGPGAKPPTGGGGGGNLAAQR